MKNSAPQTIAISIVWPKSGCRISRRGGGAESRKARMLPGMSRRLTLSENSQAAEDDEGRLEEFRRLDADDRK